MGRGGTLTIEASGTLDEVISEFNTNVDLNIQALGVVHVTAKGGMPLSITPGAAKGPFSLTIGPFTLPSNVPGSAVVKGQVHVVNSKNEAVMCVDLDLNAPGAEMRSRSLQRSWMRPLPKHQSILMSQ